MKREKVEKYINSFTNMAYISALNGDADKACILGRISADIQYRWNQHYVDNKLEKCMAIIANTKKSSMRKYTAKKEVVLFYDGFGLDTRGLALIYLKALCELGYNVVYVVPEMARYNQPEIHRATNAKGIIFHYLSNCQGDNLIDELLQVFYKNHPQIAFLYAHPNDMEACVAFEAMAGHVRRYQINLTDHAFWLGRDAFDYCIEFREYGACVSNTYRKIPAEKIRLMHYYPYFDKNMPFAGFPFDEANKPIMFSGGSLYKTYDDKGIYYDMVKRIMQLHDDLLFVYAGSGDKTGLYDLQKKFPERVFDIDERKDLYAVMKHSTFYLNTYPIIGGLMTQYAAIAGRLPLTLLDYTENSLDGLLLNHHELKLEFKQARDLVSEADKLITDTNYRRQEESKLINSVISENRFRQELYSLLKIGNNGFDFHIYEIDTSSFRQQYIHRFSMDDLSTALINKRTVKIWWRYPKMFFYRIWGKLIK